MTNVYSHIGFDEIAALIPKGSRVLDLGCGQGDLLEKLIQEKGVSALGIDISEKNITDCVQRGIPAIQGNIDEGLNICADQAFDYVLLSQTLQVVQRPDYVLKEMLRVGGKAVISFPNFCYWPLRFQLFLKGCMPKSESLPYEWYNTPNIHLCSIKDMKKLCVNNNLEIANAVFLMENGKEIPAFLANGLSQVAIFVLTKPEGR